jgi:hypothetical protein
MALLLTSVFGVTGCGSDDDEAPVESRIKNYSNESYFINPVCDLSFNFPGIHPNFSSENLDCARGSNGAGEGAEFEELEELEDFMKFDDMNAVDPDPIIDGSDYDIDYDDRRDRLDLIDGLNDLDDDIKDDNIHDGPQRDVDEG